MCADYKASNTSVQNAAGRVAAASLAFSGREQAPPSSSSTKPTPPAFHARNSSSTEDDSASASSATRNLAHTKVRQYSHLAPFPFNRICIHQPSTSFSCPLNCSMGDARQCRDSEMSTLRPPRTCSPPSAILQPTNPPHHPQ